MSSFKEISVEEVSSLANGWTQTRVFEGHVDDLTDFQSSEEPSGWVERRKRTSEQGKWITLEYVFTAANSDGTENPGESGLKSRTWDLQFQEEQHSILSHPKVKGGHTDSGEEIVGLETYEPATGTSIGTEEWGSWLKVYADVYNKAQEAYVDETVEGGTATKPDLMAYHAKALEAVGFTSSIPQEAFDLSFAVFKRLASDSNAVHVITIPTLTKVEIVASYSELYANHANAEKIFSYNQLLSAEPSLPSAALIQLSNLTGWSWLKMRPRVQQTDQGLFQMTVEYVGVKTWEAWQYDTVT